jgi:hypothetical protein
MKNPVTMSRCALGVLMIERAASNGLTDDVFNELECHCVQILFN